MCGLLGAFGPSASQLAKKLEASLHILAHRGPDASGFYLSARQNCALGHRRLAIVDLSNAATQPMISGECVLSYNGEIYNHRELRRRFSLGPFRTHSDTETVLELVKARGIASLASLEGMFAGAFYDSDTECLHLFRDALGIKPLYYACLADSTLVFGSEIKALLPLLPEHFRRVNRDVLAAYLTYENYPQGASLFQGLRLLEPGEVLEASLKTDKFVLLTTRARLKEPRLESQELKADVLRKPSSLTAIIEQSVQAHLMSDVPIGVYLSGGIDSSLVATLAARHVDSILGFTGFFADVGDYYDESGLAKRVADLAGIEFCPIAITPEHFEKHFDHLVYSLDEPRMGMGAFSQYVVAAQAGKQRKVILAGHGGDELFAGYPAFKAAYILDRGLWSSAMWKSMGSLSAKQWPWFIDQCISKIMTGRLRFAPKLFPQARLPLDPKINQEFTSFSSQNSLQQLQRYFQSTYIPGLLVVEDKISMAHSLETRVPLWSYPVMAAGRTLAPGDLLEGGVLKGYLKRVVADILPQEILNAPKRGFPTPLRMWFRHELYDYCHRALLGAGNQIQEIMPKKDIEKLLNSHRRIPLPFALDERRAHRIWILLSLESWLRQFAVTF